MMSISTADFRRVDLNLLIAFMILMEERSVSRAAARLYLGQPAVSGALSRLRRLFEDALLVRTAQGMVPTPKALELAASLAPAIDIIQGVLFRPASFDPASGERRFKLALPDWLEVWLMPELLIRLSREAPKVRVAVLPVAGQDASRLLETDEIDLGISVFPPGPGWQRRESLMAMNLCCVYDPRQIDLKAPLTRSQYLAYPHLLVSLRGGFEGLVDEALADIGRQRNILYSTPRLGALPFFLQRAPVLATVPEYVGDEWSALFGLQSSPLPLRIAPLAVSAIWHAKRDGDEALRWLRALIASIVAAGSRSGGRSRLRVSKERLATPRR
jgi:LysR family transcriptional activator of mexEF-oprN operon